MMQQPKCENMQHEEMRIVMEKKKTGIRVCGRLLLIAGCVF